MALELVLVRSSSMVRVSGTVLEVRGLEGLIPLNLREEESLGWDLLT